MEDLAQEQERFGVFPCGRGDEGLIAHYQRHIPYSSEKKMFHGKTNRDAFEGRAGVTTVSMRSIADSRCSLPVHLPRPTRDSQEAAGELSQQRSRRDVGLPSRACPHYTFLQGARSFQGIFVVQRNSKKMLT